ncbi:PqiC family protein [Enterovibrio calviensis]|uniref:PqiC family protein n=1 Tax=Enterovibrio calviensis TaxID=91359 RepID=UPI0004841FC0|nr:ABC-type transport auxiliary lipoprotein family protein [Enterovibrio calviensis]
MTMKLTLTGFGLAAAFALLSGCSTQTERKVSYYQFDIVAEDKVVTTPASKPQLIIEHVDMYSGLNEPGMVQRLDSYRARAATWHQWAILPSDMLESATANLLSQQLPDWLVLIEKDGDIPQSESAEKASYAVRIFVERFNGGLNGDAEVVGSWSLYDADQQLVIKNTFNKSVALEQDGYVGLTQALQSAWVDVNEDIARYLLNKQ